MMEPPKDYRETQEVAWMAKQVGWQVTQETIKKEVNRLTNLLLIESNPIEIHRLQGRILAFNEVLSWVDNRFNQVETKGD